MISAFGVVGTKPAECCAQHNRPRCGVEGCRGRGIDPNHSGKKTIDNASLSGSKHEAMNSPSVQANPLLGGSRGSRKRVRYLHNKPTALKRAVALEPAAEALTMPEIEGQKSPVMRDFSMKTEVHVSM